MTPDIASLTDITAAADHIGLVMRGGFRVSQEDQVPAVETGDTTQPAVCLLLFGNAGSSMWPSFSSSPEYADGEGDPLNRWSERNGNRLAREWGGQALYPFGGPPYQPFLQWAKKAEGLRSSKLGMLIHPQFGLWHAYRFAIALPYTVEGLYACSSPRHACDTCAAQPCLQACPVGAFTGQGYDVERCFEYLDANRDAPCNQLGCLARRACPEGRQFVYQADHAAFHMEKFWSAIKAARSKGV